VVFGAYDSYPNCCIVLTISSTFLHSKKNMCRYVIIKQNSTSFEQAIWSSFSEATVPQRSSPMSNLACLNNMADGGEGERRGRGASIEQVSFSQG